jgi:hypothetical protein
MEGHGEGVRFHLGAAGPAADRTFRRHEGLLTFAWRISPEWSLAILPLEICPFSQDFAAVFVVMAAVFHGGVTRRARNKKER